MTMLFEISLVSLENDPSLLKSKEQLLTDPSLGGIVTFEGRVRNHNHGHQVLFLEYEAYVALALTEGKKILSEAYKRFEVEKIICFHRSGHLEVGEMAVWIMVGAHHRKGAFLACEYIIDEIKKRLPIWKNEHYSDGSSQWVVCHHHP